MIKVNVPGVGKVNFPDEMSHDDIINAIQTQVIPQHAEMVKQHEAKSTVGSALQSGLKQGLAGAETFLGEHLDSQLLKEKAAQNRAEIAQSYEPMTDEDIARAKEAGILPTIKAYAKKEILNPTAQFIGEWAAPAVAGTVAAAALPEEAIIGGAGALTAEAAPWISRALAGKAASTAVGAPIMAGENIQYQKELHPDHPVNLMAADLAGLAQSALFSFMPGAKQVDEFIGPQVYKQARELAPKVMAGDITKDAAVKELSGAAANYSRSIAANAVNMSGLMTANEALTRAQAGEDIFSPEALDAYKHAVKAGVIMAPVFGGMHAMGMRTNAENALGAAKQAGEMKRAQEEEALRLQEEAKQQREQFKQERAADVEGMKAAQAEIARQGEETRQQMVDTLKNLQEQKTQEQIRATTFGEHTLDELGIPKKYKTEVRKAVEPYFGEKVGSGEAPHSLLDALEEVKMANKGENDLEINAKIDDYINKKLGFEKNQKALAENPPDLAWKEAMQRGRMYTHGTDISPEGYRLSAGKEFQLDLLHPGESMGVYTPRVEKGVESAKPITNDARQLGLEFGPESDRSSLAAADVGGGTEPRYDRAEPVAVGTAGEPLATDIARERPDYSALGLKGRKGDKAAKTIDAILTDKALVKSADQAKGLNDIAAELEKNGMDAKTALDAAIELRNKHAEWPAPEVEKAKRVRQAKPAGEISTLEPEEDPLLSAKKKRSREAKRVEPEGEPTTVDALNETIDRIRPSYRAKEARPEVVENYDALPDDLRDIARDANAQALTDPRTGKEYYVADKIAKGDETGVIMHEKGVHVGLTQLVGRDRVKALSNRVVSWEAEAAKGGKSLEHKIAKEAVDRALESGEAIGTDRFNQEVIAYFTETAINRYKLDPFKKAPKGAEKVVGWLRDLWNGVVASLKKLHYNPEQLKAQDIVDLVHAAARIAKEEGREAEKPLASKQEINWDNVRGSEPKHESFKDSIIKEFNTVKATPFSDMHHWLGNKLIGGRYSVANKAGNMRMEAWDKSGKVRGDLVMLVAQRAANTAVAAYKYGKLVLNKKTGIMTAAESENNGVALSNEWLSLLDKLEQKVGDREKAYKLASAGWYGPRYEDIEKFNRTNPKHKIDISDWNDDMRKAYKLAHSMAPAEFQKIKEIRNGIRKDTLQAMVDSGLYTPEVAKQYLDVMDYVPLYRVQEADLFDDQNRPLTVGSGLAGLTREHHIRGSEKETLDPMQTFFMNQTWMMERAIKNNAYNAVADQMQDMGIGKWHDKPMNQQKLNNIPHVWISKGGNKKLFLVDDPIDMAIFAANPQVSGFIHKLMNVPARLLRHGVTMAPQFVYNQALEDPMRATFVSGNKAGVLRNLRDTWTSMYKNMLHNTPTEYAKTLEQHGIIGQKDTMSRQDIIDRYQGKDKEGFKRYALLLERMAHGSDLGAREAIMKNAVPELMAQGHDRATALDLAAIRAEQFMPFQQVGQSKSLAVLRNMVPFVNPVIQGFDRDIAALRGRLPGVDKAQAKKMLTYRVAKFAFFTGAYAALMSGDDNYENQTEDQRDNNFFIGGQRVPVPQEFRPLKVMLERGTRSWVLNAPNADIDNADIAAAVLRKTWEMVSGAMPIPTAGRVPLELMANYDFRTGRPLVGVTQAREEPFMQFNASTSELAKAVGQELNVSPIKIDHFLRGYFGYIADTVGRASNALAGDRPDANYWSWPIIGNTFENPLAGGRSEQFYKLYNESVAAKSTYNALIKDGDIEKAEDYYGKHKGDIALAANLETIHSELVKMHQYRRMIANAPASDLGMTAAERTEALNELAKDEQEMLANMREYQRQAKELNEE